MIDISVKRVPLSSLNIGDYYLIPERMDDGNDNVEIRLTLCKKDDGTKTVRLPQETEWQNITRYGIIQGEPGKKPRYSVITEGIKGNCAPSFPVMPTDITTLKDVIVPADPKAQNNKNKR